MPIPGSILSLTSEARALRERLERWANINSGSDHLAGLQQMAGALEAALRELTPDVTRVTVAPDGRAALIARRRPEAARRVLCSGHYDTVYPAGSPFQACTLRNEQTLCGPGVSDMKGGIVVMLAALKAFEQTSDAAALGWEIVLSPDEEIGSTASRPLLEAAARRAHLGLLFEPARENGDIVKSRKGTGIFTIACHGRAAHAGRDPGAGRNAIVALAEYLLAVNQLPSELPGVMLNIGRISGGGTVNVVPDFAEAEINARSTSAGDAARFVERLHELAATINAREGYRLEVGGQFNRPPMECTPVAERVFDVLQAAGRELNLAPFSWAHVGGGSDGNLLQAAGLPCVDGLGAVGGNLHSPNEYIHLPSLVERAQLGALLLHRLASGAVALG
jgi:glutamate carboxypeptidase